MVKCEKCGAEVPNESKFCLNCGNPIDKSAPRHFSLEEISNQQQAQENSAFSITPDTPDDDPETYLPPIGAKEHSEIPMGEIDPEYFNHKPLPNIQAADPLELLDSNTPELPPIGFSDQMQIEDIKMPEGIRHYHGNYAVPRNMQFQTVFPVSKHGDVGVLFDKAIAKRQMMSDKAHGDKEHFSVIPKEMQIIFSGDRDFSQKRVCSFNEIFVDEYVPEKDIPSAKPKPKAESKPKTEAKPKNVSKPKTVKVKKKFADEISNVSPKKNQQPVVDEKKNFSLHKKTSPPAEENKISLQKKTSPPAGENKISLQKKESPPTEEKEKTVKNIFLPAVDEKKPEPPKTEVKIPIPEPVENELKPNKSFEPEFPKHDISEGSRDNEPMEYDFSKLGQNFTPEPMKYDFSLSNDTGMDNDESQSLRNDSYAAIMQNEKKGRSTKIIAVIAIIIAILAIGGILFMIFTGYYKFDQDSQNSYLNGNANESAELNSVATKNDTKWSNLNNGGLAAEDDEGNVYHTNSSGCICKRDTEGKSGVIYNGGSNNKYITYISVNKDRLYFLASMTGKYFSICSTDKNGKDFKVYTVSEKPSGLFSEGDFLYYITEDKSRINKINIETEEVQNIYDSNGQQIENIFIAQDKMYVLRFSTSGESAIDTFELASPENVQKLYLSSYGGEIVPLGICCCGDRIFVVDYTPKSNGKIYSAKFDGSDVRYLGGNHAIKISACDNYIYHLYISESLGNAQKAVENGNVPDILSLGRMKTNGLEMTDIQKTNVLLFSIAGDRIYYLDGSLNIASMLTDGTDIRKLS